MGIMPSNFKLLQITVFTDFPVTQKHTTTTRTKVSALTEILLKQYSQTSNFYRSVFLLIFQLGKNTQQPPQLK